MQLEANTTTLACADWCIRRQFEFDMFSPDDPQIVLADGIAPPSFSEKAKRLWDGYVVGWGVVR